MSNQTSRSTPQAKQSQSEPTHWIAVRAIQRGRDQLWEGESENSDWFARRLNTISSSSIWRLTLRQFAGERGILMIAEGPADDASLTQLLDAFPERIAEWSLTAKSSRRATNEVSIGTSKEEGELILKMCYSESGPSPIQKKARIAATALEAFVKVDFNHVPRGELMKRLDAVNHFLDAVHGPAETALRECLGKAVVDFETIEEKREFCARLSQVLDRLRLRARCPKCDEPATIFCVRGTSLNGSFTYTHRRGSHGGKTTLQGIQLVNAPEDQRRKYGKSDAKRRI